MITPIILAGGIGSRLFPLSTPSNPKQFSTFVAKPTLFENCLKLALEFSKPIVCTNAKFRPFLKTYHQQIQHTIFETTPQNTMPAIISGMLVLQKINPKATALVLSADALISNHQAFCKTAIQMHQEAQKNFIIFGITPTKAEEGYGYIHCKSNQGMVFTVKKFQEKPSKEIAKQLVLQKNTFWNAGIFMFSVKTFFNACEIYCPEILQQVKDFQNSANYSTIKKIPIDKVLIEKVPNILMAKMPCHWADLGSFESLYENSQKNANQNLIRGNVQAKNCQNCFLQNETSTSMLAENLTNCVVIQTNEGTIMRKLNIETPV